MEKVIPQGLNYADIKPEAIENMIKLHRFTPTANVQEAKPGDVIRFMLNSNGFFDPYSAYLKIRIEVDDWTAPAAGAGSEVRSSAKILDRSAHSLIGRLVIKSQGTEIERIEQYDVLAAMINDMIYSPEQAAQHHYEGFANKKGATGQNNGQTDSAPFTVGTTNPTAGESRVNVLSSHVNRGSLSDRIIGEKAWSKHVFGSGSLPSSTTYAWSHGPHNIVDGELIRYNDTAVAASTVFAYPSEEEEGEEIHHQRSITFCIPIYSGILGVLMPDKKLLPLSLAPLEIEFTLNQYALYCAQVGTAQSPNLNRSYTVKAFEIYAHTLFFEQEVHRSLEAVVAEHGIFLHYNTFYLGPITLNTGVKVQQFAQLNVHFKSINSIHWVFLYAGYESDIYYRKLNFVTHRLTSMQLRNGTDFVPSEPIQDDMGKPGEFKHTQFLIEMYKSWNKMHDPSMDATIDAWSYTNRDRRIRLFEGSNVSLYAFAEGIAYEQRHIGRTQYGITLEGEELGQDKTTLTGRKGMIPFDILMQGTRTANTVQSYTLPFIRTDMVLYVRPDLVVTVLGK